MTPKIFIADLTGRDEIETLFLVKYMALQEAKDGKKYLNIVLTDASGDLESRLWNATEELVSGFQKNDFVRARGKLNQFQGRRQFIVSEITKVAEGDVNRDDYVAKSSFSPDKMFERLEAIVADLTDAYMRELLQQVLADQEIVRRLKTWPAGKSIHHAYQSGLLEHILSCANLAVTLSRHYDVNPNYVVAGAILHDLCKIYELSDNANVDYTDEGKLVGHLVKGLEIVDKFAARIPHFPSGMRMHLKHILLSHHGEYEYGSPKIPQTSEAYLVHLIDHMDSKMNALEMVKRSDSQTGHWTGFVKHLDRIVYKSELPFYPEMLDTTPAPAPTAVTKTSPVSKESKPGALSRQLEGFKVGKE